MDINNLSQTDINELIQAEKNPKNVMEYQDIVNQVTQQLIHSSETFRCTVIDYRRNINYDFRIHTTPTESHFSVGLMFIDNGYHLLRLDFGSDLRHVNDRGTDHEYTVLGSHAHVNSPAGKYIHKNVIPISDFKEFATLKRISDVVTKYIDYTHIKTS